MHPLVNIAVSAARAAGNLVMRHQERIEQLVIEKKGRNDFVTQIDRLAEREIVNQIRKNYPQHAILAEEGGASGESEVCWIIDPIDGTTNFLHRLPHFAVSIGVQVRGRLEHGVIYAPSTQDLYTASRGAGAQLNNRRLRVSQTKDMDQALVGTGVPIREEHLDDYIPMLRAIVSTTAGVRRAGSASLDLAYVAAGRLDAFWELNLKPWDIAAGIVLVQEAGGVVRGVFSDDEDFLKTGNILATTPRLVGDIAPLLRKPSEARAP
jgi:myo-inositol-1(or 4)-monophosphatase